MIPTTEQIATKPDDYTCDNICPWITSLADKAVNKFCKIFLNDGLDSKYTYITPQCYETKEDVNHNGPNSVRFPVGTHHSHRRYPPRKKRLFMLYAMQRYSSSDESDEPDAKSDTKSDEDYMLV